jgi:hypothetical protein
MWTAHYPTSDVQLKPVDEDVCHEITWLEVPYEEKDAAKCAGARWDPEKRQWYVPPNVDRTRLHQWIKRRVHLTCGFQDKDVAKSRGARWDAIAGKWYIVEPGMDRALFVEWLDA